MENKADMSDSLGEEKLVPTSKAKGNIYCRYEPAGGSRQDWRLIKFDLVTTHDTLHNFWKSHEKASSDRQEYLMEITYEGLHRVLTIRLQDYVFTVPDSVAMATDFNDRSTLNIVFLKDAEGANAAGDHYTIKGNSRLDISL